MREKITTFVDDFNSLKDTITSLTAFNSETGQSAGLNADAATRAVERELRQTISIVIGGDNFNMLSDIGISLQVDGKLKIDEEKLNSIVTNQPDQLASFFAGDGDEGGMAGQIASLLESLVGTGGRLENAVDSSKRRFASLEDLFVATESRIEETVERYRTQFQAMDGMVAQMNQTSAYLSQQFAVLVQQNQS